jgi:hypothetical protein
LVLTVPLAALAAQLAAVLLHLLRQLQPLVWLLQQQLLLACFGVEAS